MNKRNFPGNDALDPSAIANLTYSNSSGARKVAEVGRLLKPIPNGAASWTTAPTTALQLPVIGANLAVYNPSTSGAITLGQDNTVTALGAGATDSKGRVGIPCPQGWSYIACGYNNWIIAASGLMVFLIDDQTSIRQQTNNTVSPS